jgi:ribosomal protein S18 acetylase RimI-like enzyme
MEQIQIRKATMDDLPTLLVFEQGMIEAERPFDPTLKRSGAHYYNLQAFLTSNEVEMVIAETASKIVGCGYARIERSKPYNQHQQFAYLGFMYVLPEHRGKGIIQKILDTLKNWASSKSITELRLEVYAENLSAIKAYEKAGFQPLMLQMRMDIKE